MTELDNHAHCFSQFGLYPFKLSPATPRSERGLLARQQYISAELDRLFAIGSVFKFQVGAIRVVARQRKRVLQVSSHTHPNTNCDAALSSSGSSNRVHCSCHFRSAERFATDEIDSSERVFIICALDCERAKVPLLR